MNQAFKIFQMILGVFLIIAGVLIAPLPGPFGLPIAVVGVAFLLRGSTWAKRRFLRLMVRYPKIFKPVRALLRPRAKFVLIIWSQMLKIERWLMPRVFRPLRRVRRWVSRTFLRRKRRFRVTR